MPRRALAAASLVIALGVLAAGCGGDSSPDASPTSPPPAVSPQPSPPPPPPKPWRTFRKAELAKMALRPKDAPVDLVYVRDESGAKTLAGMGLVLPRQQRTVRSFGYVGAYDAVFSAKSRPSDRRVTERIWLFKTRGGAKGWLQQTRKDAADLEFDALDAPLLGEESWAARGLIQIGGGQAITHAFRLGNAVFTVVMYGDATPPTKAGALAAARASVARAKSA